MNRRDLLLSELQKRGVATALELARALKTSQPSVSRALASCSEQVHRLGRARATRYALARAVPPHGASWPWYRIDAEGRARQCAILHALYGGSWRLEAEPSVLAWANVAETGGLFRRWPWILGDAPTTGFLGRAYAARHAQALGAPSDPLRWSDDQHLAAHLLFGEDLSGDAVLGDLALERAQAKTLLATQVVAAGDRATRYSELAQLALRGEFDGAMVGGTQPKFTACVADAAGGLRHTIVKFSEAAQTPSKRRWFDLLLCEHHAANALRAYGVAAATTELVIAGERLCLEVERYDRSGAHGRRGLLSLAAMNGGLCATPDRWIDAADRLQAAGRLAPACAERLRVLWWFGALIANDDRHFGNAGLVLDTDFRVTLAPSYDMLPMLYRPAANGEIVARAFAPPLPAPAAAPAWLQAAPIALAFWQNVAGDLRVSLAFRDIARRNLETLLALQQRCA